MAKFYIVPEIQINNGTLAAVPPILCATQQEAAGEIFSKMGYAYKNPRDYTMCAVLDDEGHNITSQVVGSAVYDNREEKTPVYAVIEVQSDAEGNIAFAPVSVYEGDTAQNQAMDTFHSAMAYAWRVNRQYTMSVCLGTDGLNFDYDVQGKLPEPEPEEETQPEEIEVEQE